MHNTWHKFQKYISNTFGKDLYTEWKILETLIKEGKIKKTRYRDFNFTKLNQRLVGYEVITKIKRWVNRYSPEIKIIRCDDAHYCGSIILLIPHPNHGITVIFIPQCTSIQNQFFLYDNHFDNLIEELNKMKEIVYTDIYHKMMDD